MTEQKYIYSYIVSSWKYWILGMIVGLVVGFAAAGRLKSTYEGTVSFQLVPTQAITQDKASFYVYDGYYSSQTAVAARNALASWLQSPRTVFDVYKRAAISLDGSSADSLSRRVTVSEEKTTSVIDAVIKSGSRTESEALGKELVAYAKDSFTFSNTTLEPSDPLVLKVAPPRTIVTVATTLAFTLLAFFITLLVHYVKTEK